MKLLVIILACLGLLLAGLLGITLSVPLQAPAVILFGVAAIVAGLGLLGRRNVAMGGKQAEGRANMWLLGLVMVATVYFVGRACYSPVWDLGVEDLMLILPAAILYMVAGHALGGEQAVRLRMALAWTVLLVLVLHLVSAAMQVFGGDGFSLTPLLTGAGRSSGSQISGMYGYYGSFANFAVMSGLLCLALGVWGRSRIGLRVLLVMLGFVAFGLAVYSQSRSALVSLVPALAVFVVLLLLSVKGHSAVIRKLTRAAVIGFSMLVLLGIVVGGVWVFQNRYQPQDEGMNFIDLVFDGGVRMAYWSMAAEQWADHPLFGTGSRSYSYKSFEYWSPNLPTGEANPEFVHNEYLQLLADYGLIGLLLTVALLAWHCFFGCKQVYLLAGKIPSDGLVRGSNAMALTIAGVSGITAMAVHVCFDFRAHLLANLLLLVCCSVWILPVPRKLRDAIQRSKDNRGGKIDDVVENLQAKSRRSSGGCAWRSRGLAAVLLLLGLGSIGLGGQQLWAGMPLLMNKMAKEDGAWVPQNVDRGVWIYSLEGSLERSSQWRRYQRLGALYRLEAAEQTRTEELNQALVDSEQAYLNSIDRHPYNPIPRINLATMYTDQKRWAEADRMYASASEMAKARERWFRMHSKWGDMHIRWAVKLWSIGEIEQADLHFLRARELYLKSYEYGYFYQNKQYVLEYTSALMMYAGFLSRQQRFDDAELLFLEGKKQVNWYNWQTDTGLLVHYAKHLYLRGLYLWAQRKPEETHQIMVRAISCLKQYRGVMKGNVDQEWHDQLAEIQEVITFLEKAGIGN